jgi:hypothetical protein
LDPQSLRLRLVKAPNYFKDASGIINPLNLRMADSNSLDKTETFDGAFGFAFSSEMRVNKMIPHYQERISDYQQSKFNFNY